MYNTYPLDYHDLAGCYHSCIKEISTIANILEGTSWLGLKYIADGEVEVKAVFPWLLNNFVYSLERLSKIQKIFKGEEIEKKHLIPSNTTLYPKVVEQLQELACGELRYTNIDYLNTYLDIIKEAYELSNEQTEKHQSDVTRFIFGCVPPEQRDVYADLVYALHKDVKTYPSCKKLPCSSLHSSYILCVVIYLNYIEIKKLYEMQDSFNKCFGNMQQITQLLESTAERIETRIVEYNFGLLSFREVEVQLKEALQDSND